MRYVTDFLFTVVPVIFYLFCFLLCCGLVILSLLMFYYWLMNDR